MTIKKVLCQFTLRSMLQWLHRSYRSLVSCRLPQWRSPQRGKPLILAFLLLLWCVVLGVSLAQATEPDPSRGMPGLSPAEAIAPMITPSPVTLAQATASPAVGTVDVIPPAQQLAQDLYLENCASCHVGLPPQIFPTDTWRNLLQDASHYGVEISPFQGPALLIVWNYIRTFSRPALLNEQLPYRIDDSRYFKALHPRVEFGDPLEIPARGRVQVDSCTTCHPNALQYDFRRLTPEWENAP